MRAAIYSRFSSDRQNENSCDDQERLCRAWCERQGFTVVDAFRDEAISGASTVNRLGIARMLRAANDGGFDVLVSEALDRISRDQADLANIRKELNFRQIAIHTVQDGEVGAVHVGIKGLMGELYLADLAQKTRRGLDAVIADGRHPGGRSFGYDLVPNRPGELAINEDEADIVRRIFAEYAAGQTPRQIVARLNAEGIPSPRGGKWNSSTINGSRIRKNGILQNMLYNGVIVWNRQQFIKNPATGKKVSRPNPESEWRYSDAEHLRIVDREVFEQAQQIKAQKGSRHSSYSRRVKHPFSGLLKCGQCGASYTVVGRGRVGCVGHRERGDCDNNRTVTRAHVEQRVLAALEQQLAAPELIAEYVRTYHEERRRLKSEAQRDARSIQKKIDALTRQIERAVDMLLDGSAPKSLTARVNEMEAERDRLTAELSVTDHESDPVELHPAAAERYRQIVADLHGHLENAADDIERDALLEEVRKLVDHITITPNRESRQVDIDVSGQLAALMSVSAEAEPSQCRVLVVAGARNIGVLLSQARDIVQSHDYHVKR